MRRPTESPSLIFEYWAGEANAIFTTFATTLSSWAAPIPEAVMTSNAIAKIVGIGPFWSALTAASLEVVGYNINQHYLEAREWNDELERYRLRNNAKTHKHTLEDLNAARRAVDRYYIVTGAIVAINAIHQALATGEWLSLLAVLFPIASSMGTKTMNRRAALHRRRARIAQEESAPEKPVSPETEPETEPEGPETEAPTPETEPQHEPLPDYAHETLAYFVRNPEATYTDAADALDCSPRTVSNHMKLAQGAGIAHRNGDGWEIAYDETEASE